MSKQIIAYAEETRTPIDWEAVSAYIEKNKDEMLRRFKSNCERYVFGTGSEPRGNNGRWMYDPSQQRSMIENQPTTMHHNRKEFTRSERHKLYKQMLEMYVDMVQKKTHAWVGICSLIDKVTASYVDRSFRLLQYPWYMYRISDFKELLDQKPLHINHTSYWWEPTNHQRRIDVLEQAIKLTEPVCEPSSTRNNVYPAAGVWRDAKTQRVRSTENGIGTRWLVELKVGELMVCKFDRVLDLFIDSRGYHQRYEYISRYAILHP